MIGSGLAAIGAFAVGPRSATPVRGRLGIDERTRDLLRARTEAGRTLARDASDVNIAVLVSYPVLVDGLINAGWYRRSDDVALQLILIDLEAAAVGAALTSVTKALVARERPYGPSCGGELDRETVDCDARDRYVSQFSGHASAGFVAASVTCMHHQYLPLWGDTSPWVPCVGGYALATSVALLRVSADMHYLSDVAVGAAVGTLTGVLVPWLHYRTGPSTRQGATWWSDHQLTLAPAPGGIGIGGVF